MFVGRSQNRHPFRYRDRATGDTAPSRSRPGDRVWPQWSLSRKYAMQLVSIIDAHDSLRFAEIEAHPTSASTSTISKRLGEFEYAGHISRTQYNEISRGSNTHSPRTATRFESGSSYSLNGERCISAHRCATPVRCLSNRNRSSVKEADYLFSPIPTHQQSVA